MLPKGFEVFIEVVGRGNLRFQDVSRAISHAKIDYYFFALINC